MSGQPVAVCTNTLGLANSSTTRSSLDPQVQLKTTAASRTKLERIRGECKRSVLKELTRRVDWKSSIEECNGRTPSSKGTKSAASVHLSRSNDRNELCLAERGKYAKRCRTKCDLAAKLRD